MSHPDDATMLELAVGLARRAGAAIVEMRTDAVESFETKSSPTDPVTAADSAAEEIIGSGIKEMRPGDGIVGEEGTTHQADSSVQWFVDPIDGTVNYLYDLPAYSVSIAAARDGRTVVGVVYNPVTDELFTAMAGRGAYLNGRPLRVNNRPEFSKVVLGTGFNYHSDTRLRQARLLTTILPQIADIRRMGSAALDLCSVAAGRIDGYYEEGLNIWDYAAGKLVVEEAGGVCSLHPDLSPTSDVIVAGCEAVADELLRILTKATI